MSEHFDVVVVGAGPGGLAAALTAARGGLSVIVIERGDYPGAKNVMGGVLYRHATEQLIPEFWKEAPVERRIISQSLWLLSRDSAVTIGYKSELYGQEPYNNFTVLRARFDRWLAEKVEAAGALIITETVVEDLLEEDGRIVGVRTGREDGDVRANLVVLAEGVNSLLTRKAGLRGDIPPNHLAVAVKEIIAMPGEKIQDRFGLEENEGATIEFVGDATWGMVGTGFIYTNRESLSVGVGTLLSQVVEHEGCNPNDILEHFKAHPLVRRLISGGETKEYMAHLIPEGGYRAVPKLFRDGLMVVGDAAMLVNGVHREGSNLAMTSGRLAGEVALEAHQKGDFTQKTLAAYRRKLEESFVLKDLRKYQKTGSFFEANPRYFETYPYLVNRVAHEFLTVDSVPKKEKQGRIMDLIRKERSLLGVGADVLNMWRNLG